MAVKTDELEVPPEVAAKLAEAALKHAALNDWNRERREMEENRGGRLVLTESTLGTLTERNFETAMQVLVDNALHAPKVADKNRAAQIIAQVHLGEMELKLRYVEAYAALHGGLGPKAREEPVVQKLPELPPMTKEQLTELIQQRRKGLRG